MTVAVKDPRERINWLTSIPFLAVHLSVPAAFFVHAGWRDLACCVVLYYARMLLLSAGYHRYFAHRSYRLGRRVQFLIALAGTTAAEKGPLWWAGHHRDHHRYADTDRDVHSPRRGVWWSHVGWILCDKYKSIDYATIADFARYPELRFLDRHFLFAPVTLGVVCFLVGGWSMLVVGFFLSTMLLWHGSFAVNSVAHLWGRRRYATPDTSRNSLLLALVTSGEGWHNNHHHYMASVRHGFHWWEVDLSYYVLRLLSLARVARDLRLPSERVLAAGRVDRLGSESQEPGGVATQDRRRRGVAELKPAQGLEVAGRAQQRVVAAEEQAVGADEPADVGVDRRLV
jgi:stearoyl-CoA desaturase (delta-9 desaturase)